MKICVLVKQVPNEDAIIKIANLVQGGRTLKEAVAALYGTNKKAPVAVQAPSSDLLENCWNSYGRNCISDCIGVMAIGSSIDQYPLGPLSFIM